MTQLFRLTRVIANRAQGSKYPSDFIGYITHTSLSIVSRSLKWRPSRLTVFEFLGQFLLNLGFF